MCDICNKATRRTRPMSTTLANTISGRVFFEALTKNNRTPTMKFEWNNAEYFHTLSVPIRFCPFCGEELQKEREAAKTI